MSSWWNITGFFSQRWEILTGSVPATINGSDTCVCFIRHMQSPGHDPNIHYLGFLSGFFPFFFFMVGSLFSQLHILSSSKPACFSASWFLHICNKKHERKLLRKANSQRYERRAGQLQARKHFQISGCFGLRNRHSTNIWRRVWVLTLQSPNSVNYMCRALFLKQY